MLATLQSVLVKAQRGRYAVGAFNVSNLEQVQAVAVAARKMRSPVIVNTSEKAISYAEIDELIQIIITAAKKTPVPVVINLDHGRTIDIVKSCLQHGCTGIMFDGSTLSYENNIKNTIAVKKLAAKYGVGVEGEIGQVKYREELKVSPKIVLATPEQAVDFVHRTKIDALAVGIGNSHGLPIPGEKLHFGLLQRIHRVVSVPLVLHGASATSETSIKKAIALGICKINIDTDLRRAFTSAIRRELRDQTIYDPRQYLEKARDSVMQVVMNKMAIFGSRGKAS